MVRLTELRIRGYRSIKDECAISFPEDAPLVLIGENNAGKSNVVKALDVILGEMWPASREPEDHDFWDRDPRGGRIEIEAFWDGLECERNGPIRSICLIHSPADSPEPFFRAIKPDDDQVFISKKLRNQCQAIVVGADRRLSYQLSYTSKWTLLSKLMRKFHDHLVSDPARVERLKAEFQLITDVFQEVEEFKTFQEGLVKQLGAMLDGMSYGLAVDFSAYDPRNFFHSLRVLPNENGDMRTFEELGTGQEQLLALVFAHAYARAFYGGIVLVIEEPEAHLHPLAQQWLGRKIREMARDGLQLILTTHSPAFVDILGLEGVALVRKIEGATEVKQLSAAGLAEFCVEHGADRRRATERRILPYYSNSATQEILSGLFARKIVLVEGQTEQLALPVYLEKAGLDVLRRGIAVIPVMGKGNLAKWWRFFVAYGLPTYVIFDNDDAHDDDGRKRKDALTTIGLPAEEIEPLLTTEDWTVADAYSIFGQDFETTLRVTFPGYDEREAEAIAELGSDSKPLIAKYVADSLPIDFETEGGKRLKLLARKIKRLAIAE
jgi:putative ATP-dependent endonuclease of OLD family